MRKFIAVGVLVGGLLAGAGSAMAQGVGDPLTLAASGVLLPYITSGGTVALAEIASPVGQNPDLHLLFFNNTCVRVVSTEVPETTNDIAFVLVANVVPANTNGLLAIGEVDATDFGLGPLVSPIHTRMYEFNAGTGRSRVFEPIILDVAEFPGNPHTWSPLRTGATFFAPLVTSTVQTELTLVCPRTTIQGLAGNEAFPGTVFPTIVPPFSAGPTPLHARVYDTDEDFLRDVITTCDCLTPDVPVNSIDLIYSNVVEAPDGTYTELETANPLVGSFTGYKASFTVGFGINNFFSRLSDANWKSLDGTVTPAR
jgi:hypothetical protein